MITKIETINNIGSYKSFVWGTTQDFKKFNLIFGENGSGKTILSKLISLYSIKEEDIYKDEIITELFNKDSILKININGQILVCDSQTLHNYDIHVFNSTFVSNNLHDGNTSNVKKFEAKDSAKVESIEIKKLNEEIINIKKIIGDKESGLIQRKENSSNIITNFEKKVRTEFNKNITGRNLTNMRSSNKFTDRNETEIQNDIENTIKEYNLIMKDSFDDDLKKIVKMTKEEIHLDIKKLYISLNTQVENRARKHVIDKFSEVNTILNQKKTIEWFESGVKLLKKQIDKSIKCCPLCDSVITDSIDEIIDDYLGYFDEEFNNLKVSLDSNKSELERVQQVLYIRNDQLMTELVRKYSYLFDDKINLIDNIDDTINDLLQNIEKLYTHIERKKNEPKYQVLFDFDDITLQINKYNNYVLNFTNTRNKLISYFQTGSKAEKIINSIKNLYIEKFGTLIKTALKDKTPIETLDKIEAQIQALNKEIQAKEIQIKKEYQKLKLESKYINEYLKKLNITKFTVNVNDNLEVIYTSGQSKKSLKHSISEGEKTTLAFAYFLSKIRFESESRIDKCIIYIDDPISSLDEDRIFYTSNIIIQEFLDVGQIFVSSHNLKFLRVLLTFAKHPFNNKIGLYQIKNTGCSDIIYSPTQLTNFTSNYYEKLQDIIDYTNDTTLHCEVATSIPNSIRIVLETFLSFKFGYLKKYKGNNRISKEEIGTSPGLSDMIIMLRNETVQMKSLISQLNEFNGINAQNFFTELNYIIVHLSNIFSHGNISTIEYTNPPITELELKSIAEKTLSIMQFLDNLNYNAIKETVIRIEDIECSVS